MQKKDYPKIFVVLQSLYSLLFHAFVMLLLVWPCLVDIVLFSMCVVHCNLTNNYLLIWRISHCICLYASRSPLLAIINMLRIIIYRWILLQQFVCFQLFFTTVFLFLIINMLTTIIYHWISWQKYILFSIVFHHQLIFFISYQSIALPSQCCF